MPNPLVPTTTRALANPTDVSDEMGRAGAAFGDLVLRTGQAIAATQVRLDANGAATASALAETEVDLIAVREKVYRDDGTLDQVRSHVRKLPLISFIDPVFYQWTSVRVQGQFFAREFSSSETAETHSEVSGGGSAEAGFRLMFGPRLGVSGGGDATRTTDTTVTQTSDQDVSYGRLRMNALLEPRDDVGIPKPRQAIRGPVLTLIQGEIADLPASGGAPAARTLSLLIQYNRRNGSPIANKAISVETNGLPWSFAGGPAAVTDADGQVEITLTRTFADPEADTAPADFIVSARIGLVQNSVTVTF